VRSGLNLRVGRAGACAQTSGACRMRSGATPGGFCMPMPACGVGGSRSACVDDCRCEWSARRVAGWMTATSMSCTRLVASAGCVPVRRMHSDARVGVSFRVCFVARAERRGWHAPDEFRPVACWSTATNMSCTRFVAPADRVPERRMHSDARVAVWLCGCAAVSQQETHALQGPLRWIRALFPCVRLIPHVRPRQLGMSRTATSQRRRVCVSLHRPRRGGLVSTCRLHQALVTE